MGYLDKFMERNEEMNKNRGLQMYPTPGACFLAFILMFALTATLGTIIQTLAYIPGLYVTEWLLILGPPLILLWRKKVDIKESLGLQRFNISHVLLGIVGGLGIYPISIGSILLMEDILGPYPAVEFFEDAFPTTWLGFIPWILAVALSAGICEEALFRGFIQNGLHNHWGPAKALIVATILFAAAHLDPWRTPAVILIGLLAGYLLIRTGSLYSAIAVHVTVNGIHNFLGFIESFPKDTGQWLLLIAMSLVLIIVILIAVERKRKV